MKKMFIVLFGLNVIIFLLSISLSSGSQSFKIAQNLKVYAELGGGSHKCNPDGDYWLTWPWNCPDCGAELNGCFWSGDPGVGSECSSDVCHENAFCGTTVETT